MLENKIYNSNNRAKMKKRGSSHYASKDYTNPFFTERNSNAGKINFDWKIKALSSLIVFSVLFLAWFVLYANYFAINNVIASGDGKIDKSDIENIIWNEINYKSFVFSPRSNLVTYSKSKLISKIEEKYLFDKIEIKREKPNTLKIVYTEKKQSYIWTEDGKNYNNDRNGYVISESSPEDAGSNLFPKIENRSSLKINNKRIGVDEKYIDFAFALIEKYKDYPEFVIEKFIIDDSTNIIKTKLVNGPEIYFSITGDIKKQLDKLAIIKNEKFKDDFGTKQYIDVSTGDSVYYK